MHGNGGMEAISPVYIGAKSEFYETMNFEDKDIVKIDDYILNGSAKESIVVASRSGQENMLTVFKKTRLYSVYNVVFCYSYSFDYVLGSVSLGNNEISIYQNGEIIISNNSFGEYDKTDLIEYAEALLMTSDGISIGTMRIGDEKCKIYAVNSDVNDWGYILAVSDRERMGVIKRITMIATVIFILAIGVGTFVIRWFTEMVYNPVRKLVDSAEIDEADGGDEFAALKSAMDKGKSRYDELQTYIKENKDGKEHFLKDFLNSNLSAKEIKESIEKYALGWLGDESFIIVFRIFNVDNLQKEFGDIDFYNVRNELVELLNEKISETMVCEMVPMRAGQVCGSGKRGKS